MKRYFSLLPEILIFCLGAYFFIRELGVFPAAWGDDGLFMIVARNIAEGHGYTLDILGRSWAYPPMLGVGPTLILPSALAIKLFGFSVAVARVPQVLFGVGAIALLYVLARELDSRKSALLTTLLLVTLSAFVNTGKPVLGEIPGFFFLCAGLLCFQKIDTSISWAVGAGLLFGISIVTKITFGLVLPALGVAALFVLLQRNWTMFGRIVLGATIASTLFLAWRVVEAGSPGSLLGEFKFLFVEHESAGGSSLTYVWQNPSMLLRLPFLSYGVFLALGFLGTLKMMPRIHRTTAVLIWCLILLFTAYYLSSFGWYRHLLPAHLLLLLFVPAGAWSLLRTRFGTALLIVIAIAQAAWQFDHRGASTATTAAEAATIIERDFQQSPLIIRQAEVFVRLPRNPAWLFLTNPLLTARIPEEFSELTPEMRCYRVLQKLNDEEEQAHFGSLQKTAGSYFVIEPPADCR